MVPIQRIGLNRRRLTGGVLLMLAPPRFVEKLLTDGLRRLLLWR